jgi:hypothetical protein
MAWSNIKSSPIFYIELAKVFPMAARWHALRIPGNLEMWGTFSAQAVGRLAGVTSHSISVRENAI